MAIRLRDVFRRLAGASTLCGVVGLAAGHREPQQHVGKRDPIWPAISGAVPSDVLADSCLPYHLCFLSAWAAPVLSTWAAPVLDMGGARAGERV